MKDLKQLHKELNEREDFRIIQIGIDGGIGEFVRGNKRRMSVIWSNGGRWDHVSIDGRKRSPTWEKCAS